MDRLDWASRNSQQYGRDGIHWLHRLHGYDRPLRNRRKRSHRI